MSGEVEGQRPPILVVGVSAAGAADLARPLVERILSANLLVGGSRHHGYFPEFPGERLVIGADTTGPVDRLTRAWEAGDQAAVVASGDPLLFGIAATLRRELPPEALEVVPAPSSVQLAFAALAEPWHDATIVSGHGRPIESVVCQVIRGRKAAILTDGRNDPPAIARALIEAGASTESRSAVCENLGSADQRIVRMALIDAANGRFAPLNVFVVWLSEPALPIPPGLADSEFSTSGGQITKREVRLLALTELALRDSAVVWDIGAGSGSVGIEAARWYPSARVLAIERRPVMLEHLRENLRRFPAANLEINHGEAPAGCAGWPNPSAVFIGGSGGRLAEIISLATDRLRSGGRLVVNLATIEALHVVRESLPDARLTQIQMNRGVAIGAATRFEAMNPVFMAVWQK